MFFLFCFVLFCFFAVYIDYPDELHGLDNDYPLTGENIKVKEERLSKYQLQIIKIITFLLVKIRNLLLILGNIYIYIYIYIYVYIYITPLSKLNTLCKFRVTIKKMHRIIEFKQEPF